MDKVKHICMKIKGVPRLVERPLVIWSESH
jgi:hypothetical protein